MRQTGNLISKNEPRQVGEVIRDLIDRGELLPNYKLSNNGKS